MRTIKKYTNYRLTKDKNKNTVLRLFNRRSREEDDQYIPMYKFKSDTFSNTYICKLPYDVELNGIFYREGDIIICEQGALGDKYDIIQKPLENMKDNFLGGETKYMIDNDIYNKYNNIYTKFSTHTSSWIENSIKQSINSILHPAIGNQPVGDISGDTPGAIGALTTEYNSSSPTDSSSSVSFDFIDDVLGTKSSDSDNGNTDYDPNAVANNTIQNSDLNKIKKYTVNELVSAYSKAMQEILSNYGNKDMYSQYSRDSI